MARSAPSASRRRRARFSSGRFSTLTPSRTFFMEAASAAQSPVSRACCARRVWGRASFSGGVWSKAEKISPVLRPSQGCHSTSQPCGAGVREVSFSPMPSARHRPPRTRKGTSAPTVRPMRSSSSVEKGRFHRRFRPISAAAASALPPPMPAPEGISLRRRMRAPFWIPAAFCSARAALTTRLFSSKGTGAAQASPSPVSVRKPCPASSSVSRSLSSSQRVSASRTDCISISI